MVKYFIHYDFYKTITTEYIKIFCLFIVFCFQEFVYLVLTDNFFFNYLWILPQKFCSKYSSATIKFIIITNQFL